VESATFRHDGKLVMTVSGDGVRLWHVPWTSVVDVIDAGIARVPRCLFERERRALFFADDAPAWCYALAKAPYRPRRYGFSHDAVDALRANRLGMPAAEGLLITRVVRGMPADAAGLRVNDVVLAADGAPVADEKGLNAALDRVPPGSSIRLGVLRAGQRLEIELKPAF
jgi:S1-C subfamily serine protease